ncbi:unnamed protein product [Rhodiola kirilowii]
MSSPSGGVPRPALADVSNRPRKRTFEGYGGKNSGCREDGTLDLRVSKQVCLRSRNLGMENSCEENFGVKGVSHCQTDRDGKQSAVNWKVANDVRGVAAVDDLDGHVGTNAGHHVIELDYVSRVSCCSEPLIPLGSGSCNGDSNSGEILQVNAVRASNSGSPHEASLCGDCKTSNKGITVAYLNLDQSESSESAKLVKPSGVQSFELERCTGLKGDGNSHSTVAADLLKACSCSFCLKAAYIWSDLHYKDVKGRISAVTKSKKEAVNMFQRICMDNDANAHVQGSSDQPSKLESDLSSQWRSLFLHMEESFARESNHLQDNFLALKDLRENCKVNLEMIDAKPADHE